MLTVKGGSLKNTGGMIMSFQVYTGVRFRKPRMIVRISNRNGIIKLSLTRGINRIYDLHPGEYGICQQEESNLLIIDLEKKIEQ